MIDVEEVSDSHLLTRRALLRGAGGAAGLAALGGAAFGATQVFGSRHRHVPRLHSFALPVAGSVRSFVSRPDLHPPAVAVTGGHVAPGYVMLGPSANGRSQAGPLMLEDHGEPVWFSPISRAFWVSNFRRGHYRGQPVLSWWQGRMIARGLSWFGQGEAVIVDSSYREVARVRAGNGRQIDVHEFLLTPEGTALFTCFPEIVPADLSSLGGPSDGQALQTIIQEVDVQSGRVLLEWRSLEHIPVEESYQRPAFPCDYMHANSIAITPDGNLLVSARSTWALYKLHRRTGQVIWRLGGKRSDFQFDDGAEFSWQHGARQPTASTITLFDNAAGGFDDDGSVIKTEAQSRGVVLDVEETRKRVRLARSYRHPHGLLSSSMGNLQVLPDGHALVCWGIEPYVSEYSADGTLLADMRLGHRHDSYRAFRYPWAGNPAESPAVAIRRDAATSKPTVYASWNGATAVSHWLVHAGPRHDAMQPVGVARRRGFETVIPLGISGRYVQATALDARGRSLASSDAVRV